VLAWAVYSILVGGFIAYGVTLVATALHARSTGDVAVSMSVKTEAFQLPNLLLCPQWFEMPNVTYIYVSSHSTFKTCQDDTCEKAREYPSSQLSGHLEPAADSEVPVQLVDPTTHHAYNQTPGSACYHFELQKFRATINTGIWLGMVFDEVDLPDDYAHMETMAAVLEPASGGDLSPIFYFTLNQGNGVEVSKSVKYSWDGKKEESFFVNHQTFPFENIESLFQPSDHTSTQSDTLFQEASEAVNRDQEDPSWIFLWISTSKEEVQEMHEIDPLNWAALVGQLGGAWSFVAIGFGLMFVRAHDFVNELRANSLLTRYLQLPTAVSPSEEDVDQEAKEVRVEVVPPMAK